MCHHQVQSSPQSRRECCIGKFMKECNVKWSLLSSKKLKQDPIEAFKETVNTFIRQALESVDPVTLTVDG